MSSITTSSLLTNQTRYQIIELLGSGGEGKVYRAFDQKLLRDVAIKLVDCSGSKAFEEAQALASIDSHYVVRAFDVFHDDRTVAIVMEIIDSEQMLSSDSIAEMNEQAFYAMFIQILQAVKDIHSKGLLHLDLKPGNILIDKKNQVKVSDFGIAANIAVEKNIRASASASRKGSWNCLAPEQLKRGKLTTATDIFSLGILLFTFMYKKHPFIEAGDVSKTQENIVRGRIQFPSTLATQSANLTSFPSLTNLVISMLSKKEVNRPALDAVINEISTLSQQINTASLLTKTLELPARRFARHWKWFAITSILAMIVSISYFLMRTAKPIQSTLVISTVKIGNDNSPLEISYRDNNLLVARIIEDEIEASVISDPYRQLVSKKEWRGTRNWQQEAQQVDVDEIIISEVDCANQFCKTSIYIYSREQNDITHFTTKSIPHSNLTIFSQVVGQILITHLNLNSEKKHNTKITDRDLRMYVDYMIKVESRTITIEDVKGLTRLAKHYPEFLGAHLALGNAYLALYNKQTDVDWLDKSLELLINLNRDFPRNPAVLQLVYHVQMLSNDLAAAEQTLEKIKRVVGMDTQQIFLDETKLNFRKDDPEQTYRGFIAEKNIRLTHGYFHDKANMELNLNYMDALELTATKWSKRFPESDVALSFLGNAYINLGKVEQSIRVYQKLTEDNEHYRYYINLATSQLLAGKYQDSILTMEKIITIFPVSTYDYLALGEAHKAAKTGEANTFFQRALKSYRATSQDDPGHEALVLAHLGRSYDARIALQKAARTQSNDSWFYFIAAQVYFLIDEPKTAEFNARKALDSGFRIHWFKLPWFQPLYSLLAQ